MTPHLHIRSLPKLVATGALALFTSWGTSQGAVTIYVYEDSGDLVWECTGGTLDLTGNLGIGGPTSYALTTQSSGNSFGVATDSNDRFWINFTSITYTESTGWTDGGTDYNGVAESGSGVVVLGGNQLQASGVSGSTATVAPFIVRDNGWSYNLRGLTAGESISASWGGDSITLVTSPATPAPEPTTAMILTIGFTGLTFSRKRK